MRRLANWWLPILLAISLVTPAFAEKPRELDWEDLAPVVEVQGDPFGHLTPEQRLDLSYIARVRALEPVEDDTSLNDSQIEAEALTEKLNKSGLDVAALLATLDELLAQQQRLDETTVSNLDGTLVRLPGYVLPIEFVGDLVTEFLLVPYVGACIHVPPPPPNQIVHVRVEDGFINRGLYTPVWVTGLVSAERSSQSVFRIDGTSDVDVGYRIDAEDVEVYKE